MKKFHVTASGYDFGIITANDNANALDIASQMLGYDSFAHMKTILSEPHEIVLAEVRVEASARGKKFNNVFDAINHATGGGWSANRS